MAGLVLAGGVPVFNVILVMNFFRNIPKSLEEAAIVDGAGAWLILLRVIIPISKPVIATVTLFTIVNYWNNFSRGWYCPRQKKLSAADLYSADGGNVKHDEYDSGTISEGASQLSNQGLNAAKIFVALIPVLLIYPFLQKYFITGITLGAVKE